MQNKNNENKEKKERTTNTSHKKALKNVNYFQNPFFF